MDTCQVQGCSRTVSKPGHSFCLDHWKAERAGKVVRCRICSGWYVGPLCPHCEQPPGDDEGDYLSSTKIGRQFGLSNIKTNLILAELGWIERYVKGWIPTSRGNALGANVREMRNGTPFVVWPESILKSAALLASIEEQTVSSSPRPPRLTTATPAPTPTNPFPAGASQPAPFRDKFPTPFRTQDGHQVRSRAEVLIDNWLYMQGIVHAYERRLPIEENAYCDFYLPGGKGVGTKGVYIEYWGLENDPKYQHRKAAKQAIYAKYALQLIELGDAEIERLDDVLPRMLLRFGIESA